MTRPLREARISAEAIGANTATLRRLVPTTHAMAIVKADGYGHGAVTAARAALEAGVDHLGVADLDEAFELRAAGIDAPVLAWLHDPEADFAAAAEAGIALGISSGPQLARAAASGHRATVHIKVDTGLSRNGVIEAEWGPLVEQLAAHVAAGEVALGGVFSHLSNTSPDDDRGQVVAFERFLDAVRSVGLDPGIRHLAASAAALDHPAARYDMVRLGIGLYGIAPERHLRGTLPLVPAMQLSARVVGLKRVPAGSGVSYGFLHRTTVPTTLALVPLGYADGVPRAAVDAPVRIGDGVHRVVGRIAMDQVVVDVGDAPVEIGDRAVLWGDPAEGDPGVDEWADAAGTIAYELVTRLGRRVHRTGA
ncbi:alanine racemase [Microcella humidisoli]|uniref:Alanine racemase n=1 Tax=Microcella humidisoli TaxID=2963406 RepID=A0ABY5FU04_9MICO|nr:alanine racemase [Microcella humidisoli]UTT61400.1 alanine racemase [Microcella humidisoli]